MDLDFDELYEQEFRKTYQYIRYMVSHAQVAEDLTQDTFVRIYKSDLTKVTNCQTYTRQVARNLVYDYYRKKALIKWLPFTNAPEQQDFGYVPHEWLIQEEDRKQLYEALQKLKPVQREVIIYRKIEELSIQETCDIMGLTSVKVANTQRSAMQALQKILGGVIDEA
ncbi:RNA polymerase sigma factor [Solibacillus kalamii]|uniref:RNA polymerase sigma factor n=1 Tax=Solibacillus kalamii TaxID=1748298 RepID=UPI001EFCE600|nr:RNA polymerase sigma factor [Solibacillus kalamii]